MFNTAIAAAAIAVAAAVIAVLVQQAKAMDVGQCFDMATMKQKLQEEGQQYIAFTNEARVDNDKDEVRVFTMDAKEALENSERMPV